MEKKDTMPKIVTQPLKKSPKMRRLVKKLSRLDGTTIKHQKRPS